MERKRISREAIINIYLGLFTVVGVYLVLSNVARLMWIYYVWLTTDTFDIMLVIRSVVLIALAFFIMWHLWSAAQRDKAGGPVCQECGGGIHRSRGSWWHNSQSLDLEHTAHPVPHVKPPGFMARLRKMWHRGYL